MSSAVALFGSGLVVAYLGYAQTSGPDGVVRSYYAALQRDDAPEALALGTMPHGPHLLLTSTVLADQQRIAPIRDVSIVSSVRHGSRATVRVRYALAFRSGPREQQDAIRVVRSGDAWRLVRTAIAATLHMPAAALRATIEGAGIPQSTVLMFPGAVPVSFDSPYLELAPATAAVSFSSPSRAEVTTRVSRVGKRAVVRRLVHMLTSCLSAGPVQSAGCPAPAARYVPGTLRGRLVGNIRNQMIIYLDRTAAGRVEVSARIKLRGQYRRLTFANQSRTESGRIVLPVRAVGYAVRPLRLGWSTP